MNKQGRLWLPKSAGQPATKAAPRFFKKRHPTVSNTQRCCFRKYLAGIYAVPKRLPDVLELSDSMGSKHKIKEQFPLWGIILPCATIAARRSAPVIFPLRQHHPKEESDDDNLRAPGVWG